MTKRSIAFLLMLIIFVTTLVSCNTARGGDDTQSPEDSSFEESADTSNDTDSIAAPAGDLTLISGGEVLCRVVRSDKLGTDNPHVTGAKKICAALQKVAGDNPVRLYSDWVKNGVHDSDAVEVLVGITNYTESESLLSSISYGEYAVRVVGKKLVIAAHTDVAISAAVEATVDYISTHSDGNTVIIPADLNISGVADESFTDIPSFAGGIFETTYLCGGDGIELIISDTDADEYKAYLKTLESAGYEEVTATSIAENEFATYENSKLTLNVGYYNYEKSVRIVAEDRVEHHPFVEAKEYTAVTTSSVTMLGCAYNDTDGSLVSNGLSMIIRLEDGSFIVVDGAFSRAQTCDAFLRALEKLSADYRKENEKIRISAWIISHPHGDHYGMFLKYYGDIAKKCTVDTVLLNMANESERQKGFAQYPDNIGKSEGSNYSGAKIAAKALGAVLHTPRVGETYYIGGAKLEILYTIDAYGPKVINAINTLSIVSKLTFKDGTTMMITGDATGNGMEICAKMYGVYLRSDIVQVAHHGGTTWGNNNGVILAYNLMKPSLVLWPASDNYFNASQGKEYNIVLFSGSYNSAGANDNFKEVFVAGQEYNATTTPIPYVEGTTYKWKLK